MSWGFASCHVFCDECLCWHVHGAGAYGGVRIVSIPIRNTVLIAGNAGPRRAARRESHSFLPLSTYCWMLRFSSRAFCEPPEEPAVNVSFLVVFRVISSLDIGRRQNLAISTIPIGSNCDSQFVVDSCSLEQVRRSCASIHCATNLASILTTGSGKTPRA